MVANISFPPKNLPLPHGQNSIAPAGICPQRDFADAHRHEPSVNSTRGYSACSDQPRDLQNNSAEWRQLATAAAGHPGAISSNPLHHCRDRCSPCAATPENWATPRPEHQSPDIPSVRRARLHRVTLWSASTPDCPMPRALAKSAQCCLLGCGDRRFLAVSCRQLSKPLSRTLQFPNQRSRRRMFAKGREQCRRTQGGPVYLAPNGHFI